MLEHLLHSRNRLDFALRQSLQISRRNYKEQGVSIHTFLNQLPDTESRRHTLYLLQSYQLAPLLRHLNHRSLSDNLLHLELLDALHTPLKLPEAVKALDIGAKNFCYAPSLYAFLKRQGCQSPSLDGIEIDGNRLYSNLYSRHACAAYYTKLVPESRFLIGDFRHCPDLEKDGYDIIFNFFPFVTLDAHLSWGLPKQLFNPLADCKRIYQLMKAGSWYIMTNTTDEELKRAHALLQACGFAVREQLKLSLPWTPRPCHISLLQRF